MNLQPNTISCLLIALSVFTVSQFLSLQSNITKTVDPISHPADSLIHPVAHCATDHLANQLKENPDFVKKQNSIEQAAYDFFNAGKHLINQEKMMYTIPIVVHIVHDNGIENISDIQVLNGIEDLNNAFANLDYYDYEGGADTGIQFCLAKRDPQGNATNGITRTVSTLTEVNMDTEDGDLKGLIQWDPLSYVNVWLVRDIDSSLPFGVAGYAVFPGAHGTAIDGVVQLASLFGSNPSNSIVQAHELGHYFGLHHTFSGGCTNNDCLADGDQVCDTPPDNSTANIPCSSTANTCTTDVNLSDPNNPFATDQNDMIENFMDYSAYSCVFIFTQGQADRMEFFLTTTRASLLSSNGCSDPCPIPLTADFTASQTSILVGETVNFMNNTTNAESYEWTNNGTPFSNLSDPSLLFPDAGFYDILLTANNSNPLCLTDTFSVTIEVVCPVDAEFTVSNINPFEGETVEFTNESTGATSYQWTANAIPQGSSTDFTISLATTGPVLVCLEATSSICTDTYCETIFFNEYLGPCENTFFRTYGEQGVDEGGLSVINSLDGNLFVSGFRGDSCFIMKANPEGAVFWQRSFNFTTAKDKITSMIIDSDNNIVACGRGGNSQTEISFIFKYDHTNDVLLWSNILNGSSRPHDIFEVPGGDYHVLLMQTNSPSPGSNDDAVMIEVHQTTGLLTGDLNTNYTIGSSDVWFASQIYNDDLFVCGRYATGTSSETGRGSVSRFDIFGNEIWSKVFLVDNSGTTANLFAYDLLVENDEIITIHMGDEDDMTNANESFHLLKSDIDGNVLWAKEYEIGGYSRTAVLEIQSTPDGYVILGANDLTPRELFLLKTDKDGNLMWANSYGETGFEYTLEYESNHQLLITGENIYFTGKVKTGNDVVLARLNADGEFGDDCPLAEALDVTVSDFNNPYQGDVDFFEFGTNLVFEDNPSEPIPTSMQEFFSCSPYCLEDCTNGIDDDEDGLVDHYDPDCPCLDVIGCGDPFFNGCPADCNQALPEPEPFAMEELWSNNDNIQLGSPMVADVDGDCIPDVVSYDPDDGKVKVLDSNTGLEKYNIYVGFYTNNFTLENRNHFALGDVDNDGMAEIFINAIINASYDCAVIRIDFNSTTNDLEETWQSDELLDIDPNDDGDFIDNVKLVLGLADFDYNGVPEVYAGNQIFHSVDGVQLVDGGNNMNSGMYGGITPGSTSIGVDVLGNDACPNCEGLELIAGGQVIAVNIASYNNVSLNSMTIERDAFGDGLTRVVDFDKDGDLDAVVARSIFGGSPDGQIRIWDLQTTTIIAETNFLLPNDNGDFTGAPTISDLDDDGWPEILVASYGHLFILGDYQSGGASNWGNTIGTITHQASMLENSGFSMAAVFDLNGDGTKEIIHRDLESLVIYDNELNNISSISCGALTWDEVPIVADINGDGETEFLIDCSGELKAFRSANTPWIKSRRIWNQQNYFVVNVNDNGSIPRQQQWHHIVGDSVRMNSFMEQQSIYDQQFNLINPVADATLTIPGVDCGVGELDLIMEICNQGDNVLPIQTPIQLYLGDPTVGAATIHSTIYLPINLPPDSCLLDTFPVPGIYGETVYVIVNDDGSIPGPFPLSDDFESGFVMECDYANNMDEFFVAFEPPLLDLGPDVVICDNAVHPLDAGEGFVSYKWQNLSTETTFTAYGPGLYWVDVVDPCGGIQSDTIELVLDQSTVVDIGPADTTLCSGSDISFLLSGFDDYAWYPDFEIDCANCEEVTIAPTEDRIYTIVATNDDGCISVDSILLTIADSFYMELDTVICSNEIFEFDGEQLMPNTFTPFYYSTLAGCDSIVMVNVYENLGQATYQEIDTLICGDEPLIFNGVPIPPNSTEVFFFNSIQGCDSTIVVNVIPLDAPETSQEIFLCDGDSVLIFGDIQNTTGIYTFTFTAENGCDSTHQIELTVLAPIAPNLDMTASCFEENTGAITANVTGGLMPYNYDWNPIATNAATIEDLAPGLYTVTITDSNDCVGSEEITVTATDDINVGIAVDSVSCFGEADGIIYLLDTIPGLMYSLDGDVFQTTQSFEYVPAGNYTLYMTDDNDCLYQQEIEVLSPPELQLELTDDLTLELGDSIELQAFTNTLNGLTYVWTPITDLSCIDCPETIAKPLENTEYTLLITDELGCTETESVFIRVDKPRKIFIPTGFSPNGDGYNDLFYIHGGSDVESILSFKVFDRWGELIFEQKDFLPNDPTYGWDGTFKEQEMNNSVFVYLVEVAFLDGAVIVYQGDVTLLR